MSDVTEEARPVARWSFAEKVRQAERLPWVRRLKTYGLACDGIKWGAVAGRDIYAWGPKRANPPRGIQLRAKCKRLAKWHFRALAERSPGETPRESWHHRSGNYCWHHLVANGLYASVEERDRVNRWFREHPEEGK